MSLEIQTFVPQINDDLIPLWMQRMNGLGMRCEIYPGFSFNAHSGFLPFKVLIEKSGQPGLAGVEYLTGFEYYLEEYSYRRQQQEAYLKPSLFQKLFHQQSTPSRFASPEIDLILSGCTYMLSFRWGIGDSLELRMAVCSSLILSELTHGISLLSGG